MTIFYILITAVISSITLTIIKMQSSHKKELDDLMEFFEDTSVK